jgi:hypothetical protein
MRLAIVLALLLFVSTQARATVPQQISIQGVLRNGQGALQTTTLTMTARFFDSGLGGGNQYGGDISLGAMVPVVNGLFTVAITLPPTVLTALQNPTGVYLELQINGEVYPRQLVTSELYALMCGNADTAKNALAIGGVPVASTPSPTVNQVLTYSPTGWTPGSQAGATATATSVAVQFLSGGVNNVISVSITPPGPGRIVITATGDTFTFHNTNTQDKWHCCISDDSACLSPFSNFYIGAGTPGNGTTDVDGFPISLSYAYTYSGSGGSALPFHLFCQVVTAGGGVAVENLGMFATYFPNSY